MVDGLGNSHGYLRDPRHRSAAGFVDWSCPGGRVADSAGRCLAFNFRFPLAHFWRCSVATAPGYRLRVRRRLHADASTARARHSYTRDCDFPADRSRAGDGALFHDSPEDKCRLGFVRRDRDAGACDYDLVPVAVQFGLGAWNAGWHQPHL